MSKKTLQLATIKILLTSKKTKLWRADISYPAYGGTFLYASTLKKLFKHIKEELHI